LLVVLPGCGRAAELAGPGIARASTLPAHRSADPPKTEYSGQKSGANLWIAKTPGLVKHSVMSETGPVHHAAVHYSGRVQAVGFRYTALQLARGYDVAGYVQNLADGRVRLELEGEKLEVDGLLAAIEERMEGFIRQAEKVTGQRNSQFHGFTIR